MHARRILLYLIPMIFAVAAGFQNCASFRSQLVNQTSSVSGSNYCLAHPSDSICLSPAPVICSFNGVSIAEGASVTAYLTSSVTGSNACSTEVRTCTKGVLSGSFSYANCATGTLQSCLFNGVTVASGASATAYLTSTVPFGSACASQTRTCTNGALSGSSSYASCAVAAPAACLFNGQTVQHGSSITAYATGAVSQGLTCTPITRTCYNGALSGNGEFSSCNVSAFASCLFNGQTLASGASITAYSASTVPYGQTCSSSIRTCTNGNLSGSGDYGSCVPNSPASCLVNGQTVASGSSITLYFSAVDSNCSSEVRTCTDGSLSGSASYGSCQYPQGSTPIFFDFATLTSNNGNCNSTNLHGPSCASAFSRACIGAGYTSGFGPLEITGSSAQAVCLNSTMVAPVTINWAALQAYQPTCSAANSTSAACNSAVHHYCMANGYANSLNIVEYSNDAASFNCLIGPGSVAYSAAWGELYISHHGCMSSGDPASCSTAVSRFCQSLGKGFNSGFGIQESQILSTSVVCLLPQAAAVAPETLDSLEYFAPQQSLVKNGDMALSQIVDWPNKRNYMLKYNNDSFYEAYVWDDQYIYFAADDTDNSKSLFYSFRTPSQARTPWMPIAFNVGAALEHDDNLISHYQLNSTSKVCQSVGTESTFPFAIQLREHIPQYKTSGSLGTVDVIVVSYTYQGSQDPAHPTYGQERFYFARTLPDVSGNSTTLGWIRWENYSGLGSDNYTEGALANIQPSTVVDFSSVTSDTPTQPILDISCGH